MCTYQEFHLTITSCSLINDAQYLLPRTYVPSHVLEFIYIYIYIKYDTQYLLPSSCVQVMRQVINRPLNVPTTCCPLKTVYIKPAAQYYVMIK